MRHPKNLNEYIEGLIEALDYFKETMRIHKYDERMKTELGIDIVKKLDEALDDYKE